MDTMILFMDTILYPIIIMVVSYLWIIAYRIQP